MYSVIKKYKSMIYGIIYKYRQNHIKEDLFQECCIKIIESYNRFNIEKARESTYIYVICDNCIKNYLKKENRYNNLQNVLKCDVEEHYDEYNFINDSLTKDITDYMKTKISEEEYNFLKEYYSKTYEEMDNKDSRTTLWRRVKNIKNKLDKNDNQMRLY